MAVKRLKLPNNTTVDINDARVVSDDITYIGDTISSATYESATASIKYVQDKNDEVFFPATHVSAVVDDNGTPLSTKLDDFVTEEDLEDLNFVTYPTFSINDSDMHLRMSSPDSSSLSLFSLDADGHLVMTV